MPRSIDEASLRYTEAFESYRLHEAISELWRLIGFSDRYINEKKPWATDDDTELRSVIANAAYLVSIITSLVRPFLPQTATRIVEQIRVSDQAIEVKKGPSLFPRLS